MTGTSSKAEISFILRHFERDGLAAQGALLKRLAEAVTATGFEIVFRTWGDTRVARIRADWTALGAVLGEDEWEVE